jgi:hypothetical protein
LGEFGSFLKIAKLDTTLIWTKNILATFWAVLFIKTHLVTLIKTQARLFLHQTSRIADESENNFEMSREPATVSTIEI